MSDQSDPRHLSAQADRARRRSVAILTGLGAVLLVAFLLAFAAVQGWWPRPADAPPPERPTACSTPSLPPAASITVNVYNSTDRVGLAGTVARSLREQGITISQVENDPLRKKLTGVAEIRYGPSGEATAKAMALRFPGATLVAIERASDTVDVAVGAAYSSVSPATAAPSPSGC